MSEYSRLCSRWFLSKSTGRSRVILVVFWSPPESPFFAFFVFMGCPVLQQVVDISLIVLGENLFTRCSCLHFIPHIHTPKKWLLSLPRYGFTIVFYSKRARCISHSSRRLRARADVFFLSVAGKFATHVGINPFTSKNQSRFS